jgi:hypothetical protein
MLGVSSDTDTASTLVGSGFVDVILAFINDFEDIIRLPYLSAKMLLQSLIVAIIKHDFDSKLLKPLYPQLRKAVRKALSVAMSEESYDLRQLGISVAQVFIKTRPGIAGSFVPYAVILLFDRRDAASNPSFSDSLETIAQLIVKLGHNGEDILVQQALSFVELTLLTYVNYSQTC